MALDNDAKSPRSVLYHDHCQQNTDRLGRIFSKNFKRWYFLCRADDNIGGQFRERIDPHCKLDENLFYPRLWS